MTTPEELIAHLGFKTLDGSVRTVGLEKFGRPNIEMLLGGQEEDQVAIRILREAAAYTVLKTKVYDGEKIGIPIYRGGKTPVAQVGYLATQVEEPKRRLLRRGSTGLIRLSSVLSENIDEPPALELATEALEVAHEALSTGAQEHALDIASWSVDIFPGSPVEDEFTLAQAHPNAENYHAYELLFELSGNQKLFEHAFERSLAFQRRCLGVFADEISAAVKKLAQSDSTALGKAIAPVQHCITSPAGEQATQDASWFPPVGAPLVSIDRDTNSLVRPICAVPSALAHLYNSDKATKEIESEFAASLTEEVLTTYADNSYNLALFTRSANLDWRPQQVSEVPVDAEPPSGIEPIVSAILATIGLCRAFDFTWDDMRVYFGLSQENVEAVAAKQERLTEIRYTLNSMSRFARA